MQVEDDAGVFLDLSWDALAFLPEVRRLLHFIRTAVTPALDRVADAYLQVRPAELGIGTVALRWVNISFNLSSSLITNKLFCQRCVKMGLIKHFNTKSSQE